MQLSRFTIVYQDTAPDEHVLYSVMDDRYAGIDSATLAAIERWQSGQAPRGHEEIVMAELLLENGFLTVSRAQDDERLRRHLARTAEGMPGTMYITLMPTLACNLACNYCFQKESPAFNRMTPDVECRTVQWILDRVAASGCRKLLVHYFGGEPLTRKDYVLRTARAFSQAMSALGGEFDWEMTTNAVHLDLAFVTALREYGEGGIKVTLDGDRETHDQARVYRDGEGTFDRIFANVLEVAGHVRLRIGGNFYAGQEASYYRLIERLDNAGVLGQLEAVRFKPVIDTSRTESSSCTGCSATAQTADTLVQINRSVEQRLQRKVAEAGASARTGGSAPPAPAMQVRHDALPSAPCELHWKNSYIIDPDGSVYKCPAVAGRAEMAVAHVAGSGPDKPAPLTEHRPWEQCGDCAYLPVCMGGCLGSQYLSTGRTDQVHCRKLEFDVIFREQITARYQAELYDQEWDLVEG